MTITQTLALSCRHNVDVTIEDGRRPMAVGDIQQCDRCAEGTVSGVANRTVRIAKENS